MELSAGCCGEFSHAVAQQKTTAVLAPLQITSLDQSRNQVVRAALRNSETSAYLCERKFLTGIEKKFEQVKSPLDGWYPL
jgi:hypothetical protein